MDPWFQTSGLDPDPRIQITSGSPKYEEIKNTENLSKIDYIKLFLKNFYSREKSIITDLFYSQIISIYKCICGKEIYGIQNILDYPLLLPMKKKKIDLINLLENYFGEESIEFFETCNNCKKANILHTKNLKIAVPPKILIFSLERKNIILNKKNDCIVSLKEELDMANYIDLDLNSGSHLIYKLYGVINHTGSLEVGHYYSYIKLFDSNI